LSVEKKLQEFFMENNALEKFENSIRAVLTEGGWESEDTDSAIAWIKEAIGIQVAVQSGV